MSARKLMRGYRSVLPQAAATTELGCCPDCGKRIAATKRGLRRLHRDRAGVECSGSDKPVARAIP